MTMHLMCKSVLIIIFGCASLMPYRAVVQVPVADCLIKPTQDIDASQHPEDIYDNLPLSPEKGSNSCPRCHQILFNEVVEVLEETVDGQVKIIILNPLFYGIDKHAGKPVRTFWTLRGNLTKIAVLAQYHKEHLVPMPIFSQHAEGNTLVLCYPWYEEQTSLTYSFGTRFVRIPHYDTPTKYAVQFVNCATCEPIIAYVHKDIAMIERDRSFSTRRQQFVGLLNDIVDKVYPRVIACVWGGGSFTYTYKDQPAVYNEDIGQKTVGYWTRKEGMVPASGFDSSELVLRVAQTCGIPYPYKTTAVAHDHLRKIQSHYAMQEGDLIWIPGLLAVISSLSHNEVITVRGYAHGFGKVVRLKLHQLFEDIYTYHDLWSVITNGHAIKLLDAQQKAVMTVHDIAILDLESSY